MIDERVGSAELERLAELLVTPCQLGPYALEGLICRTSTALVFFVHGGVFGTQDGVLKLTGKAYAPLLDRELRLLNGCRQAGVEHVVRPRCLELEWLEHDAAAMLLPFLDGGDLVQWIGAHAASPGTLGPLVALEIGNHIGGVLRSLLQLPTPLVHRDVKPQNVLLSRPGAPLTDLTLIDLDISEELKISHAAFASAPPAVAESLVGDVRGFGELLFDLATGHDPPTQGPPNPRTGNAAFDALVETCLTSVAGGPGYVSMSDGVLWRDLEAALVVERVGPQAPLRARGWPRFVPGRRYLALVGAFLFLGLVVAVASKVLIG